MGILDGFWFWIGKALAELAVFAGVVVFFGLIVAFIMWSQERDRKRHVASLKGKYKDSLSPSDEFSKDRK